MSCHYESLVERIREVGKLESVESLLDWDQETYMPPKGLGARAEQMSLLARLIHTARTHPEVGEHLSNLNGSTAGHAEATNIRETRRAYERAIRVPGELVGKIAKVSAHAKGAWVKAREAACFAEFAPHLKELLELKRELADLIGYEGERYDALMDEFEPGAKTTQVAETFAALRKSLVTLVEELKNSPVQPDASILHRHYPRAAQEVFARKLASAIGFSFDSGRIDTSTHPFCSGNTPHDVRLTTRYQEDFFSAAVFGTLHEAGHGVYEQGLDSDHVFTPMGSAVSLGIHESQSRLWENMVGRSRVFWEFAFEDCKKTFPEALSDVSLDNFFGAINVVKPSFIRVEADEVTYNLHIILRFEMERAMIDGSLAVDDIPEAWNAKMRELFGITPPDDGVGCLQDIHWSMGTYGYFPTYALGNLYAAQFFSTAKTAIPDLDERIRKGDFGVLLDWLRTNIYRHGQRYRAGELLKTVTGEELSVEPFIKYLRGKFSPIYGLS
jgi:carboxypeptidase Taq